MPRKKNEKLDQEIDNIDFAVRINDEVHNTFDLVGKSITLNLKKESFFGLGEGSMWLTKTNYTCVVPDNLTDNQMAILKQALKDDVVRIGSNFISPIDRDENVLKEYWDAIKPQGLEIINETSKSFIKLKKIIKYGSDRNWTGKEILKYCIENEKKYKGRENTIKNLTMMHNALSCPDSFV